MSKKGKNQLKKIYDNILNDNVENTVKKETKKEQKSKKEKLTFKQFCKNVFEFNKNNYIALEMTFMGLLLLCLGFIPAIKIISYQFLETLNVSVNFFHISGWLFSSSALSTENVFLSLFSLFYIFSSLALITLGLLILLKIIKKNQFLISSIMHLVSVVLLMCFFVTFALWVRIANDADLVVTGINVIYYNFSTIKVYTLIYFNLSLVMIAYTAIYIYHNRKFIFKKTK